MPPSNSGNPSVEERNNIEMLDDILLPLHHYEEPGASVHLSDKAKKLRDTPAVQRLTDWALKHNLNNECMQELFDQFHEPGNSVN
jgi:hypothetical protein